MAIVLGYKKRGEFVQECFNTSFELERRVQELAEKFGKFEFEFLKEYGSSSYNSKLIKDLTTETQNRKEDV